MIDDDDNPFDARGLLKDGRTYRVSMQMRDAAPADQFQALADAERRRRVQTVDLVREYDAAAQNAWRNPNPTVVDIGWTPEARAAAAEARAAKRGEGEVDEGQRKKVLAALKEHGVTSVHYTKEGTIVAFKGEKAYVGRYGGDEDEIQFKHGPSDRFTVPIEQFSDANGDKPSRTDAAPTSLADAIQRRAAMRAAEVAAYDARAAEAWRQAK